MKYERLTDREIAETLKNTVEKSWDNIQCFNTVNRPPQSWCYVEEIEE